MREIWLLCSKFGLCINKVISLRYRNQQCIMFLAGNDCYLVVENEGCISGGRNLSSN